MTQSAGPALVVLSGLPGVGKTSIATELARLLPATVIRIDAIELALQGAGASTVGAAGYGVAYAVARDNLRAGLTVIADCVNPLAVTRDAWRDVAADTGATLVNVEIVCSNREEHRRRVEERLGRTPELSGPTWAAVEARDYAPWNRDRTVVDTAALTPTQGAGLVVEALRLQGRRPF